MRSILLSIAILGCGTRPQTAASRMPPAESCEGAPTVDGSREACLLPPYAPAAPGQLADGTPFERRGDTASWIFHLPAAGASATAGTEDYTALLERMRARGGRLQFLSYGIYCGDAICLSIEADLCEVEVEALATEVIDAIRADEALPNPDLDLVVTLGGAVSRRCAPEDPECGPVPFINDDGRRPPLDERSEPFHLGGARGGACAHDGDCVIGGCGNRCWSWTCPRANSGSTCEGYLFDEAVYCGCVHGTCGFFTED